MKILSEERLIELLGDFEKKVRLQIEDLNLTLSNRCSVIEFRISRHEMTDQELASPTECDHIGIEICDSGYGFLGRRDIGLHCEDCGTEWDVQIKQGFAGATIKLRSGRDDSK